jgi:hypothetical protein
LNRNNLFSVFQQKTEREKDRKTERQKYRKTDKQRDKQTERQTNKITSLKIFQFFARKKKTETETDERQADIRRNKH